MQFEDFLIETVSFEVRYKEGFLYWDNFGKLYKSFTKNRPDIELINVETKEAFLRIQDKFIDFHFGPEKSFILGHTPKSIDEFCILADNFLDTINNFFEINTFTRIGNRFVLALPCETREHANDLLINTKIFSLNQQKVQYLGKNIKEMGITISSHSDEVGCKLNLRSEDRKLAVEIVPPYPAKIETPWFKPLALTLDIDYFTIKPVGYGILKSSELIKTNFHKLKLLIKSL